MSGHSKWATIKRQKELTDAKKGKVFTKLASVIALAARLGPDIKQNAKLRLAIEKAKTMNMPSDNIERAIRRGSGEGGDAVLTEVLYEAYGPGGVALIIEGVTDNKNRTVNEVRSRIEKFHGRFGETGSVAWMFERKGVVRVTPPTGTSRDDFELILIDMGAEDISEDGEYIQAFTAPANLFSLEEAMKKNNIAIESSGVEWRPKTMSGELSESQSHELEKLLESLDELDDVHDIYLNR